MFLTRCNDGKIHFEFPIFEDHSYNSICNIRGVRNLIKRKINNKYILFRTRDQDINKNYIIGYYKVGKIYFQETRMFNNNGFVCGFESSETKLLKKGQIIYNDPTFRRGHNVSWHKKEINKKLNNFLDMIINIKDDYSSIYKNDTNRMIEIFKDREKINEWKNKCQNCKKKEECFFFKYNEKYDKKHETQKDLFKLIFNVYDSNIYSKNILDKIQKKYISC